MLRKAWLSYNSQLFARTAQPSRELLQNINAVETFAIKAAE
jgi:hypothetical protein